MFAQSPTSPHSSRPEGITPQSPAGRGWRNVKLDSVRTVFRALDAAGVRFLVAGGLAVNVHGVHRFTKDIDLVIDLDPDNVLRAFAALGEVGYRPSVPIRPEQMADPEIREALVEEKGMQVLQFWSDQHRETPIDVFVREPFPFAEEYARQVERELPGTSPVRFVSRETLITMKREAGRPRDLADVEDLRLLENP